MSFQVRAMQAQDVPQACAILNRIIAIGGTTAFESEFGEAVFAEKYLTGADIIACHVAIGSDGSVAGFQWIGKNPKLPETCADIASFARDIPGERGVGRALFPTTCNAAQTAGYSEINATIRADNAPGLSYYSKMGFADHSVATGVPLSDGTPVDRISKRYSLI